MHLTQAKLFAGYNAWANRTLFDVVQDLGEAACRETRPAAFFGSILGTLNHLLVVDYLWFPRLDGVSRTDLKLNQVLFDDLAELRAAREAEDARIIAQVGAMDETSLAASCAFKDSRGNPWTMPLRTMLATIFNHQTHHRGQVHALLKDAGLTPPSLDLPVFLRAAG